MDFAAISNRDQRGRLLAPRNVMRISAIRAEPPASSASSVHPLQGDIRAPGDEAAWRGQLPAHLDGIVVTHAHQNRAGALHPDTADQHRAVMVSRKGGRDFEESVHGGGNKKGQENLSLIVPVKTGPIFSWTARPTT